MVANVPKVAKPNIATKSVGMMEKRMKEKEMISQKKLKEKRRLEREDRRRQQKLNKKIEDEEEAMTRKIAIEERKLLVAQRKLESIRLLDELLDRVKVNFSFLSSLLVHKPLELNRTILDKMFKIYLKMGTVIFSF